MKALLLAAGRGTRISRYLGGNPKCTVDIGGQKLIQYTIDLLRKKGITDIAMVLGYRADVIERTLEGQNITFYKNPFFDVTNSIASAWFARDFLKGDGDTLIMNADVYLEESLLDRILACQKSPVMFADGTRKEEADYKFQYHDGKLEKYGKELTGSDISANTLAWAASPLNLARAFPAQAGGDDRRSESLGVVGEYPLQHGGPRVDLCGGNERPVLG